MKEDSTGGGWRTKSQLRIINVPMKEKIMDRNDNQIEENISVGKIHEPSVLGVLECQHYMCIYMLATFHNFKVKEKEILQASGENSWPHISLQL